MGKLVVLKLGEGSFEQGFPVTLQIGEEERYPSIEIIGKLPPIPEIPQYYKNWSTHYRSLGLRSRLEASAAQVKNYSVREKIEDCCSAAQILRDRLNAWLYAESFRPIREKLLEQLSPQEEIRLIIQTENIELRRLPWHLWDFCDRYSKAEIALSPLSIGYPHSILSTHSQVRILAILGNSVGINIQADRLLLEQLPNAEISFLVEPNLKQLHEELWRQSWDILFFAGHSSSENNGKTGTIHLNQTDSLTLEQLKFALKKAVEQGLKIAMFNSCDGLGLAQNLADLQIPQIVIMREPVPDRVSQEFLKYFLATFARGESFYLAIREARERLQGLEDQFPCATWLPMIFQNPAVVPPTWQQLCQSSDDSQDEIPPEEQTPLPKLPPSIKQRYGDKPLTSPRFFWRGLRTAFLLSVGITSLVLGVRRLGFLQPMEWQAFDHLMQVKPAELPDSRFLVVTVTEEDIQAQGNEPRRGSLSDRSLAQLLKKLDSYNPKLIGLDIYRDFPVEAKYPELAKYLKTSDRFIAVCEVSTGNNDPAISPPPEVPKANLGFSEISVDPDQIVRRHLLAMTPSASSPCTPHYAFSTELATRYLQKTRGISLKITSDGNIQLGKVVFQPLDAHSGGYQGADSSGHQILLNYRFYRSPEDFVQKVTLSQVLKGEVNPDHVKDRIVLIGVTAQSAKDFFNTPYGQKIPGVVLHAQNVSQILSAVLNERPLIGVWAGWTEALWIWGWSLVGGLLVLYARGWQRWALVLGSLVLIYGLSFEMFKRGVWTPLVPAALVLVSTSGGVFAYTRWQFPKQTSTFILQSQL